MPLINPAKRQSGKLSKKPMAKHKMISIGLATLKKKTDTFISFDIADFYPSISENVLDQALSWASNLEHISKDISIIKHARKSLLFNDGKPWIKKDNTSLFDRTIGS